MKLFQTALCILQAGLLFQFSQSRAETEWSVVDFAGDLPCHTDTTEAEAEAVARAGAVFSVQRGATSCRLSYVFKSPISAVEWKIAVQPSGGSRFGGSWAIEVLAGGCSCKPPVPQHITC